jgi:hypothetical protein
MKIKLLGPQFAGLLCLAALIAGFASGCGKQANARADKAAVAAAQGWLSLIDNGNYSESWKTAAPFFQGAVTEPSWTNSMESFRKPLGGLISRKLKSARSMTQLPGAPDGQYVVMQFETSFANKKTAIETVTMGPKQDGQWRAAGYFIN